MKSHIYRRHNFLSFDALPCHVYEAFPLLKRHFRIPCKHGFLPFGGHIFDVNLVPPLKQMMTHSLCRYDLLALDALPYSVFARYFVWENLFRINHTYVF